MWATHFGDSAEKLIFSSHGSLWDGDLQKQHHHAIHLYQPRDTIHKLFALLIHHVGIIFVE
jgi:hypothetical protein